MAISERTRKELDRERCRLAESLDGIERLLDRLHSLRAEIKGKIDALDEIAGRPKLIIERGDVEGLMARIPIQKMFGEAPETHSVLGGLILGVLKGEDEGLRAQDVSRKLEREGFKTTGSTPLNARVASELHRLANQGKVKRVRRGVYTLPSTRIRKSQKGT